MKNPNGDGARSARVPTLSEAVSDALARLEHEQSAADADQSTSDVDQSTADADQAASDLNQVQADADQRNAAHDQAASDRETLAADADDQTRLQAARQSRREREAATVSREATTAARREQTLQRLDVSSRRDRSARLRDLTADARDRAAEIRDAAAMEFEEALDLPRSSPPGSAREYGAAVRAQAAADRAQAAADRAKAALDREQAARDRADAQTALRHAHRDELTGAFRRGVGRTALNDQIERARRSDGTMVLAFADVDGLKQTNDSDGHLAGDRLLRDVADAIRSKMRGYEPIVRWGGDEFLCALQDVDIDGAKTRFAEVQAVLDGGAADASISVGFAALGADDTLDQLIQRSDDALVIAKAGPR